MEFRRAREDDLPTIVAMLADDPHGKRREDPSAELPIAYARALAAIDADPSHLVIVADDGGTIAGFLQLSFLPNLTYTGGTRAQIEGVRVAKDRRGGATGGELIVHAVELAEARGARLVQLTCDKGRPEVIDFYQGLGFFASHEGLKLHLQLAAQAEAEAAPRPSDEPLALPDVERVLADELSEWSLEVSGAESSISRTFEFTSFAAAVRFMTAMAPACDELNHHPTQTNVFRRVHVALSTHSAGNRVTALDLELARRHDAGRRRHDGV